MKIQDLISKLTEIYNEHGDIEVIINGAEYYDGESWQVEADQIQAGPDVMDDTQITVRMN